MRTDAGQFAGIPAETRRAPAARWRRQTATPSIAWMVRISVWPMRPAAPTTTKPMSLISAAPLLRPARRRSGGDRRTSARCRRRGRAPCSSWTPMEAGIDAVRPRRARSDACLPRPAGRDRSTTIWSALTTVDRRWAMTSVVRPLHHLGRAPACTARLGLVVERRGRLVEHQDRRIAHDGAGDRQALALAARQRHAVFADRRVVALRLLADEARRPAPWLAASSISASVASARP